MVERFRPSKPVNKSTRGEMHADEVWSSLMNKPVVAETSPPPKPAPLPRFRPSKPTSSPAPEGPFKVGEYIQADITDAPVGMGNRFYLVIHVYPRKGDVRLFYAPMLIAFDYPVDALARNTTVRRHAGFERRLLKRIKDNRSERKALGMKIGIKAAEDTKIALNLLSQ